MQNIVPFFFFFGDLKAYPSFFTYMDNLVGSVKEKKTSKKAKTKKKPVKVVYISNPMKFKISASEFMALVQKHTGQDAELPDPTKFDHVGNNQTVPDASKTVVDHDHALEVPTVDPFRDNNKPERPDAPFESFDDAFMSPMFENFSEMLVPSSLLYESAHVDAPRSLDAM